MYYNGVVLMSRTYKNNYCGIWNIYRRPRGKLNAIRNGARKGSIPPDTWDDITKGGGNEMPWKVAEKLFREKRTKEYVIQSLKTKFRLTHQLSRKIADSVNNRIIKRGI